jgi:hypothetical protein
MVRTMKLAVLLFPIVLASSLSAAADADKLSSVRSPADLEAVLAATTDAALRQALKDHSAAILAAAQQVDHAAAVQRVVEGAAGKVERINTTPESLKKAAGADLPLFDTLKSVDLSVANMGPHDHRLTDPYDAAFFEHLGHVRSLESLNIIATKLGDDGIAPLAKLTNLKTLRFTNNGKLSDAGLEKLAGLPNVETFNFVGTGMQGHAFADFKGWTRLTRCSFRGSSIDDEGLRHLCEHFPNLENISLAHAKFTDAGAVHLAKLSKLKGLEIGSRNATPSCLDHLPSLPLEYLQLGDGLDSPEGIAKLKNIATLRRLTLTHCDKLSDDGLKLAAGLTQLEQLEIGGLPLPDERLPQLTAFSHLKILQLVNRPKGYPPETQAAVRALLPGVDVKFP